MSSPVRAVTCAVAIVFACFAALATAAGESDPLAWPQATREARPWTRWWPFGGPWVSPGEASSGAVLKAYDVQGGTKLAERLPEGRPQHVTGVSEQGERVDLTGRVADAAFWGRFDWCL